MAYLKLYYGRDLLGTYPLGDRVSIGRHQFADIVIDNPLVSRRHCLVYQQNGVFMAEDAGAPNGLYVNGKRVQVHILNDGDEITVGKHQLIYSSGDAPHQAPSPTHSLEGSGPVDVERQSAREKLAAAVKSARQAAFGDSTHFVPPDDLQKMQQQARVRRGAHLELRGDKPEVLPITKEILFGPGEACHAKVPPGLMVPPVLAVLREEHGNYVIRAETPKARLVVNGKSVEQAHLSNRDTIEVRGVKWVFRSAV